MPVPLLGLVAGFSTSALSTFTSPITGGSSDPGTIYIQVIVKNGATLEFSNALALNIGI